jgi:hypothetical protein
MLLIKYSIPNTGMNVLAVNADSYCGIVEFDNPFVKAGLLWIRFASYELSGCRNSLPHRALNVPEIAVTDVTGT